MQKQQILKCLFLSFPFEFFTGAKLTKKMGSGYNR